MSLSVGPWQDHLLSFCWTTKILLHRIKNDFIFSGNGGNEEPGIKIKNRICTPPLNGGLNCSGESVSAKECAHMPGGDGFRYRATLTICPQSYIYKLSVQAVPSGRTLGAMDILGCLHSWVYHGGRIGTYAISSKALHWWKVRGEELHNSWERSCSKQLTNNPRNQKLHQFTELSHNRQVKKVE